MLVIPYGHDQSVYGRQWATWALIAVNIAVFGWSWMSQSSAEVVLDRAEHELVAHHILHPSARIDPHVLREEPLAANALRSIVQDDENAPLTEEDEELEGAARRVVSALHALPSYRFGYRPAAPSVLTFATSVFMHADLWHLLGNLLFLWLAGAVIECFWDRLAFLALYVLAGAGATFAHQLAFPDSAVPLIGASGAISGLLGAFVVGYPRTRIRLLYFVPAVGFGHTYARAWLLIPAWLAVQIAFAFLEGDSGVAHWAHIGGFAVGLVSALFMRKMGWVIEDASRESV